MSLLIGGGVRLGAGGVGGSLYSGLPEGLLSASASDMNPAMGVTINESAGRRAVSAWADQINSRDAVQATVGNQPEYIGINENFNGAPTVTGNGTSYQMSWNDYATVIVGDDTPSYRCIVLRSRELAALSYILSVNSTAGNHWDYLFASVSNQFFARRMAPQISFGTNSVDTDPHILEIVHHGTTATLTLDGVVKQSEVALDGLELVATVGTLLSYRYNGNPGGWSNYDIARILLDPTIPSVGSRTTIRTFLGDLYGISTI